MALAVSPAAVKIYILDAPNFFNPTEPLDGFANSEPLVFEDAKQVANKQIGATGKHQIALTGDKGTEFSMKFLASSFEAARFSDMRALNEAGVLQKFDMTIKYIETGSHHQLLNVVILTATTGINPAADASSVMTFNFDCETSLATLIQTER